MAEKQTNLVEITPKIVAMLGAHRKRTGISLARILKVCGNKPKGLTLAHLAALFAGRKKETTQEILDCVTGVFKSAGDKIKLTEKQRTALCEEHKRTGLGARALLRHAAPDRFIFLNKARLDTIISGKAGTMWSGDYERLMELYRSLPDGKTARAPGQRLIPGNAYDMPRGKPTGTVRITTDRETDKEMRRIVERRGYINRGEFVRDLIREDMGCGGSKIQGGEHGGGSAYFSLSLPPVLDKWVFTQARKCGVSDTIYVCALIENRTINEKR